MFYVIQLLWVGAAYYNAKEEFAWSFPFREIYFRESEKQSEKAHRYGAAFITFMILCCSIGVAETYSTSLNGKLKAGAIAFYTIGGIYWLLFDIFFAKLLKKDWWYLGTSANTDNFIQKYYGKDAGKIKAGFLILSIIALNIFFITTKL
jgi:hypothetical protein